MKAAIFCGGLGTRLREETEFRPKPMVMIGERPILWHIMKHYSTHGIKEFVLILGFKADAIRRYFMEYEFQNSDITFELGSGRVIKKSDDHDEFDWIISFVDTGPETLKGGRLKRAQPFLDDDTFLMTYGDGVANVDISALLEFHKSHGRIATMTGANPSARFGELLTEGDRVVRFSEKPEKPREYVNGGYFVFNKRIFDYVTTDMDCDLEVGAMEKLALDDELMLFRHDGFWGCMDTQRDVDWLRSLWVSGAAPWKTWA